MPPMMREVKSVSERPRIKEPPESAELREAFENWAAEHGMIWFDNDTRLAEAIAKVLNIDLVWGDRTKKRKP
jgi:hypothetical protein